MITLTAIVVVLGLGWAVIKVWNAFADAVRAHQAEPAETAKQG